jgi:hypothetical protein
VSETLLWRGETIQAADSNSTGIVLSDEDIARYQKYFA